MMVSIKKVLHAKPNISVRAYTFPLAVFSISSLKLNFIFKSANYYYPHYITFYIGVAAMIVLIIAWFYASIITVKFICNIRNKK